MKRITLIAALLGLSGFILAQEKPAPVPPAPATKPAAAAKTPEKAPLADYYRIERIAMPPGLSAEVGGMDFLPDGRLVACFHRGEVYIYDLRDKSWKLFANGLHDPLGVVAVSDREIVVMQRPELTRLRDTDGDGVADDYSTVSDAFGMTGNYHEFAFGPIRDKEGNFYVSLNVASSGAGIRHEVRGPLKGGPGKPEGRMYSVVPWRGWILKITPDGKTIPHALGFRSPNGLGFDAEGRLFVPDNQGDWIGSSPLYHVEQGKFYGHVASLNWKEGETRPPLKIPVNDLEAMRTRPAIVFPHTVMAGSPTQPILDSTGGKFGSSAGQMLIGDYNRTRIMRLMMEQVGGQLQGACGPMIEGGLGGGINRLAFAPDGSLWVGHTTHGWGGSVGIDRITPTGKTPLDVKEMHLTAKGFELVFTRPVHEAAAALPSSYKFKRYYYKYHSTYGALQSELEDVPVTAVKLSADRLRASLELEDVVAARVYELNVEGLKSADDGSPMLNTLICYTLNRLLENPPPAANGGNGGGR
jgi:hypothetical protein